VKTLLLLRHAKSSWDDPALADFDRPLNERGKRDAPRVGELLRRQELRPDAVVCSSAKRARKTATKVLKASGFDVEPEWTDELYHADPETCVRILQCQPDAHACVLLVGHNPTLQDLLARLAGGDESMPTAALARIELPVESWSDLSLSTRGTLRDLWRPKELD
jgi:phosphohistidine phosphatase